MKNSHSKRPNFTAQMLIAFGLFLLVLTVFYFLTNKDRAIEDSYKANSGGVSKGLIQGNKGSPLAALDEKVASKRTVIHKDNSAIAVNKVVAESVSIYTESSVDDLRLLSRDAMQSDAIYREGLDAYLQKDYALAYKRWKRAAERNHAKSYFNLGLLADDSAVAATLRGIKGADYYFKKAEQLNYTPALAMSGQSGVVQSSVKNIETESVIDEEPIEVAEVKDKSNITESMPSQATEPVLEKPDVIETSVRREAWVAKQNDKTWTIQVRAFREKEQLQSFLDDYEFGDNAAYFKEESSKGVMYKLVLGAFKSRDSASEARDNLPTEVRAKGPWLRRFGDIKKTMIGS